MNLGIGEITVIVFMILLLFGGKRLPETARQLGRGISDLRRSYLDVKRDLTADLSSTPAPRPKENAPINAPQHTQPRDSAQDAAPDS